MRPTKITIRCEADSPHSVQVHAWRLDAPGAAPYFATELEPGEEAVLDKHEHIRIVIED